MLDPVSVALKFGFLAVLYLFLLWVARSALKDLRREHATQAAVLDDGTGVYPASAGVAPDHARTPGWLRLERGGGHAAGVTFELDDEATFGRAEGVDIHLEDPFASSRHARIVRQGDLLVLEDLGSTNGTYLNDEPVQGPQPLHAGDRIRIGGSEFSYHQ